MYMKLLMTKKLYYLNVMCLCVLLYNKKNNNKEKIYSIRKDYHDNYIRIRNSFKLFAKYGK